MFQDNKGNRITAKAMARTLEQVINKAIDGQNHVTSSDMEELARCMGCSVQEAGVNHGKLKLSFNP